MNPCNSPTLSALLAHYANCETDLFAHERRIAELLAELSRRHVLVLKAESDSLRARIALQEYYTAHGIKAHAAWERPDKFALHMNTPRLPHRDEQRKSCLTPNPC